MRSRTGLMIVLLLGMIVVPMVALGALGWRFVEDQDTLIRHEVTGLLESRLADLDHRLGRWMDVRQRTLLELARETATTPDEIRTQVASWRRVRHILVVEREEGAVVFPPPDGPSSARERAFLERTRVVWEGGGLESRAAQAEQATARAMGEGSTNEDLKTKHAQAIQRETEGWHHWFHDGGLNLLAWHATAERIVAIELPREVLMAELMGELPNGAAQDGPTGATQERTALIDASGRTMIQWGPYDFEAGEAPRATLSLSAPLGAWSLAHYTPASDIPAALRGVGKTNLLFGLTALGLALMAIALFIYRERTRAMRLAQQRVSFVNQVSHELKTPLTNIRIYAELLDGLVGDEDPTVDRYLGVVTSESERLSRMIHNVLSFAREQEGRLSVSPRATEGDAVVQEVVQAFEPAFQTHGVTIEPHLNGGEQAMIDPDALRQILSNILGNIEKYATDGPRVIVESGRRGANYWLRVTDGGPGIPKRERERVFQPFVRLAGRLTDGVTGTGIGLDIARRIARLHGGELRLVDAPDGGPQGASVELTIFAPVISDGGADQ